MKRIQFLLFLIIIVHVDIAYARDLPINKSIDCAIDSLKIYKYKSAISILENSIDSIQLSDCEQNQVQILLQIAYFHGRNFKFDLIKLESSIKRINDSNLYNINGFITVIEANNNLKMYEKSISWGKKGLILFKNNKYDFYYIKLLKIISDSYKLQLKYNTSLLYLKKAINNFNVNTNLTLEYKDMYYNYLTQLAYLYSKTSNFNMAIETQLKAIKGIDSTSKKNIIDPYFALADYYFKSGNEVKYKEFKDKYFFAKPRFLFDLKEIFENSSKKNFDVRDYKELIVAQKKTVQLNELKYGLNSLEFAASLSKIASYYAQLSEYDSTLIYQLKCIEILKSKYYNNELKYYKYLADLALYYAKKDEFQKSIEIGNRVLKLYQLELCVDFSNLKSLKNNIQCFGNSYSSNDLKNYIIYMHNLAFSYAGIKDYHKAIDLQLKALALKNVVKPSFSDDKYKDNRMFETLSYYYEEVNDYDRSYRLLQSSRINKKDIIIDNFFMHTDYERNLFWDNNKSFFDMTCPSFSLRCFNYNDSIKSFAYDNALFTKGLLLNTSLQIQHTVLASGDTALIRTWEEIRAVKNSIQRIQQLPLSEQKDLPELEAQAEKLDKVLTQKSQIYKQSKEALDVKWQDVQAKLQPNEAAIEFVSFRYNKQQPTDSVLYYALVLTKDAAFPELIPLFEQRQLDSLLRVSKTENQLYNYRNLSNAKDKQKLQQINYGKQLYQLVWQPLLKSLKDCKRIYYAPSGSLHQLAFAAIPVDSTGSLLCDAYDLHCVTSTRQVGVAKAKLPKTSQSALFGGVEYNLTDTVALRANTDTQTSLRSSFVADSCSLRSGSFSYLQGTADEVNAIDSYFHNKGIDTRLYLGKQATETNFKKLNTQSAGIIHIATHGFYLPLEKSKEQRVSNFITDDNYRKVQTQNPMLRSGLALYGANHVWAGKELQSGLEDGILTAQEIAQVNLTQTELVVLSACNTGLGDVQGSEGVFGLQRAFKMAGAKSLIISLWEVPDAETAQLMGLFYKYWLGGQSKHQAFTQAQSEMRTKNPNPKAWAGFVLVD